MKKADIAMIILIASVSVLIAYFVANSVFGGLSGSSVKVKTIDPIDSTIIEPSSTIFNKDAINPAVEVQINSSQAQSGAQ
jgi:mannitol-specific phosphotransferase system IIBC component